MRVFLKKQEVIDGFKVFDPFMNKKREERKKFVRNVKFKDLNRKLLIKLN